MFFKIKTCIFWWANSTYITMYGATINKKLVNSMYLYQRFRVSSFRAKHPVKTGITFLHDNARPNNARLIRGAVQNYGLRGVLPHPSCPPDFIPSDHHVDEESALREWSGSPGSPAYVIAECWSGNHSCGMFKHIESRRTCEDGNWIC